MLIREMDVSAHSTVSVQEWRGRGCSVLRLQPRPRDLKLVAIEQPTLYLLTSANCTWLVLAKRSGLFHCSPILINPLYKLCALRQYPGLPLCTLEIGWRLYERKIPEACLILIMNQENFSNYRVFFCSLFLLLN